MYALLLFCLGVAAEKYNYSELSWNRYAFYNYSAGLQLDVPYRFKCRLPVTWANFNLMMAFRNETGGGIFTAQMYKDNNRTQIRCQSEFARPNSSGGEVNYHFTDTVSFYFGYTGKNFVVITQGGSCELNGHRAWKNISSISASLGFRDFENHNFAHSSDYCNGIECLSRI